MTLDEIYAAQDRWSAARDKARAREVAAQKRQAQCRKHLGTSVMVEQIATALTPMFPASTVLDVLGPFGLTNETSIHAREFGETVGSLTFRPDDNRLVLVDRRHVTKRFPAGSLGAINGMNYREVPLPPDGIDGLYRLLLDSITEGRARRDANQKPCGCPKREETTGGR